MKKSGISILLAVITLAVAGCQQTQVKPSGEVFLPPAAAGGMVTIEDLARQLGLKVAEKDSTYYTLKNSGNTVLIFTFPNGQYFVNGKVIGQVGRVEESNGRVLVSQFLVSQIRSAMNAYAPLPPTQYPARKNLAGCVVIDAGHGGKDPGAIGRNGAYEKSINLAIAKNLKNLLEQRGLTVVMTRSSDRFVDLDERADIANRNNAKLFVSIHSNARDDSSMRGFTVYVSRSPSGRSETVAESILRSMSGTGLENQGMGRADYRVLVGTRCPAVLVEVGYLSNSHEASLLIGSGFQNRIAQAIADGICDAF
ncbi:MAG: N-acetylmuramoyl-L-alanine amidase [Planctomycetota bacterium]|nr:N-acetylmuramoyl-L-alanine amidase [Planctomycetota bacterium]